MRDIRFGDDGVVTKRATAGRAKLLREIEWLRRVRPWAPAHFPEVLGVRFGDGWAEYDMPFCPWPTLAELVLSDRVSADGAVRIASPILDLAFREVYARQRAEAPREAFRTEYLQKLVHRVGAGAGQSRTFDALCRASSLEVNGAACRSPLELARAIDADRALCARLQPPHAGPFHGDFKIDNFLVAPVPGEFILIDPRGSTTTGSNDGDYLEDVAKLRTSTRGLYDLVRGGMLRPVVDGTRVHLACDDAGRRAAGVLAALDHALMQPIPARAAALDDAGFAVRLAFLTPMLLLANAPFQLAPVTPATERIAVALFAIGALLLEIAVREVRCEPGAAHLRALQEAAQ
ncbi:MAG TPA: hypothetical protein VGL81_32650 [Polyangiaceae bacterium]